jgi:hypothetical protein
VLGEDVTREKAARGLKLRVGFKGNPNTSASDDQLFPLDLRPRVAPNMTERVANGFQLRARKK